MIIIAELEIGWDTVSKLNYILIWLGDQKFRNVQLKIRQKLWTWMTYIHLHFFSVIQGGISGHSQIIKKLLIDEVLQDSPILLFKTFKGID